MPGNFLDDRSADILRAAVEEFIRTGQPVSSEWLYDHYDFGIKPAMIRLELNTLTDQGYLDQPHHAAGRVPSDKGYEFFAENLLDESPAQTDRQMFQLLQASSWEDLLGRLSETLGALAIAARPEEDEIHKGLLENLIDNLEWNSRDEIKAVIRDFEELDGRVNKAWRSMGGDHFLKVFIGRKSPFTRSDFLSVFAGDYEVNGEKVLLCAIGPKRMNYGKAAKIFKGLKESNRKSKKEKQP